MANIIVVFESRFGQAQKIADHITEHAKREGHFAHTLRASLATRDAIRDADAFIIVAPVYFARHAKPIRHFLWRYTATLLQKPLAFVTVCNAAADPAPETRTKVEEIALRTLDQGGVHADLVVAAAGAFAYPRYNFFVRQMMRFIAKKVGAPTDLQKIHELTNWDKLDHDLAPFLGRFPLSKQNEDENGLTRSSVFA